jgi:hypothetical protein
MEIPRARPRSVAEDTESRNESDFLIGEVGDAGPGLLRRDLVPSEREQAGGARLQDVSFDKDEEQAPRVTFGQRIVGFFKDANPGAVKGPKLPMVVLALQVLIAKWDDTAQAVLLPEIREEFGVSLAFLGLLGTVLIFVSYITAIPVGWLADRIKRVWMVRFGAIVANASSLLFATARGVPQIVGARAMAGVGGSVGERATYPLLADYYASSSRARVISFLSIAGLLGAAVGPSIAGNLSDSFGWRAAVFVLAVFALAVSLATFTLKEPKRWPCGRRSPCRWRKAGGRP